MCGIVGLFLRDPAMEPELGRHLAAMLVTLSDRGPDSAGLAVYAPAGPGRAKVTVQGDAAALDALADLGAVTRRDTHAVIEVPLAALDATRVAARARGLRVMGAGEAVEIYKEVGAPRDVVRRFGVAGMAGTHGVGHTRMATESAVTTEGAHPFSTGPDQCLVHNGSLSNHNAVRRRLAREGMEFETANDTEVAAAYLSHRMREGAGLREAMEGTLRDLDGFFTFVVGTRTGFAVVRDPVACKPAVLAETDAYVAFGSEYRALAALPGIENARVWEPEPATVYAWER